MSSREPDRSSADELARPLREKPRVILKTEQAVEPVLRDPIRTVSTVLAVIGGAVCLVWLTEMLLLWFPLDLENPAWTFGTVVQTVDTLPSAAVGGALLIYGLIGHPQAATRFVRWLSTVFAALAVLFLLIALVYRPSIPSSLAQAPDVFVQPLRRTVIQTVIGLLVAAATCSGVAVLLWRAVMKSRRPAGS